MTNLKIMLLSGHIEEFQCERLLEVDGIPFTQTDPLLTRVEQLEQQVRSLIAWASSPEPNDDPHSEDKPS